MYLDRFIEEINADDVKVEEVSILETQVKYKNKMDNFYSLNEIVVRYKDSKIVKLDVEIVEKFLERFRGDGLIIATSFGSTAHNLSYGGSIVYGDLPTLQITPLAPINSKAYTNLVTSIIIPRNKEIMLLPNDFTKNMLLTIDGEHSVYQNVDEVRTYIKDKKIKCLRFKDSNFSMKVNEKLLSK